MSITEGPAPVGRRHRPPSTHVNDDPTSDASWFTPPDRGSGASSWPAAPPAFEPSIVEPPAPGLEEFAPLETFTVTPPPRRALATALAPPTPLIRPVLPPRPEPSRDASAEAAPPVPAPPDTVPVEDSGGPGWRVRSPQGAPPAPAADALPALPSGRLTLDLVPAPPPPPVPLMPWEKRATHRPLRRYLLFGTGLFALCGLTALVFGGVGRSGPSIQQPSAVGALTQVDTPQVSALLQTLDRFERSAGAGNVVTGAYGTGGQPQLLLVVVQGAIVSDGGTRQAVDTFMRGLTAGAGGAGWTLDPSKLTVTTADGTTFECDSGPSSQLNGDILGACAWTDPGVAGAVVDVTGQPLADTLNEAVQARAGSVH